MVKYSSNNQYRSTQISTADRIKIISLLYDGAINFLNQSKIKMQEHDLKSKGVYLTKASRIVSELNGALNTNIDKELTSNLQRLYEFVNLKILEANMNNNPASIDDSIKILKTLKEGWDEMSEVEEKNMKLSSNFSNTNQTSTLTLTI